MIYLISDYCCILEEATIENLHDVLVERDGVSEQDALNAELWARKAQDGEIYDLAKYERRIIAVVKVE